MFQVEPQSHSCSASSSKQNPLGSYGPSNALASTKVQKNECSSKSYKLVLS